MDAEIAEAQIIGHDDDDVGPALRSGSGLSVGSGHERSANQERQADLR